MLRPHQGPGRASSACSIASEPRPATNAGRACDPATTFRPRAASRRAPPGSPRWRWRRCGRRGSTGRSNGSAIWPVEAPRARRAACSAASWSSTPAPQARPPRPAWPLGPSPPPIISRSSSSCASRPRLRRPSGRARACASRCRVAPTRSRGWSRRRGSTSACAGPCWHETSRPWASSQRRAAWPCTRARSPPASSTGTPSRSKSSGRSALCARAGSRRSRASTPARTSRCSSTRPTSLRSEKASRAHPV